MRAVLELSRLGKSFFGPKGEAVIVRDVNLAVREHEVVAVIGHSGCGKSTILSIVMGLAEPTVGGVILDGKEIRGPGTDRGVVFQSACLLPWLDARGNVDLAVRAAGRDRPKGRPAEHYLRLCGLDDEIDASVSELSAGMRQRVGIARALALEPRMLLLDEPFSLLDALTRIELQDELLRLLERDPKTVVMVTHDVDEALVLADRVVMMTSGPAATIGGVLEVPFARPRRRSEVLEHPDYYCLRDRLVAFLETGATAPAAEVA